MQAISPSLAGWDGFCLREAVEWAGGACETWCGEAGASSQV